MATMIFVNLPVNDLTASKAFFSNLGYSFNPQFTDENAACLVISDTIFAMLLTKPFFQTFTTNEVASAGTTEAILALSTESHDGVDSLVEKAIGAGGVESREPQDIGFMYSRAFRDLDGHTWEIIWMDPDHVES